MKLGQHAGRYLPNGVLVALVQPFVVRDGLNDGRDQDGLALRLAYVSSTDEPMTGVF